MVRLRDGQWRLRRQVDWSWWRRFPYVLCRRQEKVAPCHARKGPPGSSLPFRFRRHQSRGSKLIWKNFMTIASTDMPVTILAGGLATRLRPITEKVPKLMRVGSWGYFLLHTT